MATQAKHNVTRGLSLFLAAILMLGMLLIPTEKTQAAQTVTVANINDTVQPAGYHTEISQEDQVFTFTFPESGTLGLTCLYPRDETVDITISDLNGQKLDASYSDTVQKTDANGTPAAQTDRFYTNLTKGQTYNLTIRNSSDTLNSIFHLFYAPGNATLKSGAQIFGGLSDNSVSYYKINVPKNGYLDVQLSNASSDNIPNYSVKLLNAKKKAVTHAFESINSSKNFQTTFGVKKGSYYLAVKGSSDSPIFTIKATTKAVKTKAGSKKAKAVLLKKGKTKKGVIYAKNKKVSAKHWYKIRVTKRKKVSLTIDTKTSTGGSKKGCLNLKVIPAKGKGSFTASFSYSYPEDTIQLFTVQNRNRTLNPGVYYICVSGSNYGNGYYSLKWK